MAQTPWQLPRGFLLQVLDAQLRIFNALVFVDLDLKHRACASFRLLAEIELDGLETLITFA